MLIFYLSLSTFVVDFFPLFFFFFFFSLFNLELFVRLFTSSLKKTRAILSETSESRKLFCWCWGREKRFFLAFWSLFIVHLHYQPFDAHWYTVIAQIFVRDLISYISYFLRKVRNLVAYQNHTRIQVYLTPPSLYEISSVRKSANARVRNFYAYENFCDYSIVNVLVVDGFTLLVLREVNFLNSNRITDNYNGIGLLFWFWQETPPHPASATNSIGSGNSCDSRKVSCVWVRNSPATVFLFFIVLFHTYLEGSWFHFETWN